jgi:hypothetical protein
VLTSVAGHRALEAGYATAERNRWEWATRSRNCTDAQPFLYAAFQWS